MNEEFKNEFEKVKNHVLLLCTEWQFYNNLYNNKEHLYVINNSASFFFNRLQIMLIDSMILKIAKLLENKEQRGNKNLNLNLDYILRIVDTKKIESCESFYYAVGYIDGNFYTNKLTILRNTCIGYLTKIVYWCKKKPTLDVHFDVTRKKFELLKPYRNKNIAHIDLKENVPLPSDVYELLSFIIKNITRLMNRIEVFFQKSETVYELISIYHGTDTLIMDIIRGQRYKELLHVNIIDKHDFAKNWDRLRGK